MKRIITLTMLKNEADIIEIFVRYTMCFAKKMYLIDNGSTDGSVDILKSLQKDGFDIAIYDESKWYYDQSIIENKYLRMIAENETFDFIAPLDADEFLSSDADIYDKLNDLSDECVNILKWRTYCMTDESEEGFILDRIRYIRIGERFPFTKVILPHKLLREKNIFMSMGHHSVFGIKEGEKKSIESLFLSHFPVRGRSQISLKSRQGILTQLLSGYHRVRVFQWSNIVNSMDDDVFDILRYSLGYALQEEDKCGVSLEECPFDYSWCKKEIAPRYNSLARVDPLYNLYRLAEMICIKDIVEKQRNSRVNIIVFGTGDIANVLNEYIDHDTIEVLRFVNSSAELKYSIFNDRLVITPEMVRYIDYDKVVIASVDRDEEMRGVLMENMIPGDKIWNAYDLVKFRLQG